MIRRTRPGITTIASFAQRSFMVEDVPDVLCEEYCTLDDYWWISPACFNDFRDRFRWEVIRDHGVLRLDFDQQVYQVHHVEQPRGDAGHPWR